MTDLDKFGLLEEAPAKTRCQDEINSGVWETNDSFTIEKGQANIEAFVATWTLDEQWLHCIDHLQMVEEEFAKHYKYSVKFSIPTRQKPIPTATASVYFTLSVSKLPGRGSHPVSVSYQVEGARLTQPPGTFAFRQHLLYEVLASKNKFVELVTF